MCTCKNVDGATCVVWRNRDVVGFGQGGDFARFGESPHVGRRQIEDRRGTLVDQTTKVFKPLKVFSGCNGDGGAGCHFSHFIHAAGGSHRLFYP